MTEMRTLTIDVTADDLTNGQRQSCTSCPVALAVNRLLVRDLYAHVWNDALVIRRRPFADHVIEREFNPIMVQNIQRIDCNDDVTPFSFRLRFPVAVLR